MRFVKVFGIRRPLRSLPLALLSLALAERLGGEVVAATELAIRGNVALAVPVSPPKPVGSMAGATTDTILHDPGEVAHLYQLRLQAD